MLILQLSDIIIKDNRQRQEFDPTHLQDLKNSIEAIGLMHPVVVREEEGKWVLVAGERRMRAIEEILLLKGSYKFGTEVVEKGIPCVPLGELSPLEAEEAELDENFRRRDLTWQEHAAAVARLHALRGAQKAQTTSPEEPQKRQSYADTALEALGKADSASANSIRQELIVAKHLDNPVIQKAKNAADAFKLLKKEETRQKNIELAAAIGATYSSANHTLLNEDCIAWMGLPENHGKFDVILTDPPYGMGADKFGDGGGKMAGIEHHYDDSYESWQKLMGQWSSLSWLVTKPMAHAYVFCDFDRFHELKKMMETAGWYVFRTPLIVYKVDSGRVPLPDKGPRRQYETILYGIKGGKNVTNIYSDVIQCKGDENMTHGAQKPVALFENLLLRSVKPGDNVLDTFAGTFTILPAAHTYKCNATAIEKSAEYFGLGLKRAKALDTTQLDLVELLAEQ